MPNKTIKQEKSKAKKPGRKPRAKQIETPKPKEAAIVIREPGPPKRETMTEAKILEAFDVMGITSKLDQQKKKLFLAVAQEFRLNPLRREIHAVKMGGGDDDETGGMLVPVVGYEVYIDRAEETGRLEYWYLEETGEIAEDWRKSTYRVTLVIKRRDWAKEFHWSVRYAEAVGLKWDKAKNGLCPNSMWRKRGHFMTQKCAIGQGFRLVFREILRGMPYIDAEIENTENGQEHEEKELGALEAPQAIVVPAPAPAETPPIQFPAGQKGAYAEVMAILNERVKSKEGQMIALFGSGEAAEWKHKADEYKNDPEGLQGVQQELESVATIRRKTVKGEV